MINADYSNYDPIEFFNFTNNTAPKSLSEKAMLDIATSNNRAKDAILEKAAELAQVKHDAWISDFMYNQSKNRDNSIATKMDAETFDIRKRMYEDTSENIDYQKYLNEMRAVSKSIQDTDQLMKNAGYTFKDYDQQYIDELKKVDQALDILAFCPKKGATIIRKVLLSAIANAEHNNGADIDELSVQTIYVEKGTVLRRFTARAKGRGNRILKPTCHIYITVADEVGVNKPSNK